MKRLTILPLLVLASCGDDLKKELDDERLPSTAKVVVAETEDGFDVVVDASEDGRWVRVDLDRKGESEEGWDLAFQRFVIISNGGASGDGGVEVALVERPLAEVSAAPDSGFVADAEDGEDDDPHSDSAFLHPEPWYAYSQTTHALTPHPWTYVVRSDEGRLYALQITGYYDDAGTSGFPSFHFRELN